MVLRLAVVRGTSMEPTLRDGDTVVVDTLSYRLRSPRCGEVILVEHPRHAFRLVKRIVAAPGEEHGAEALTADEYAVEGDNPASSTDSRSLGPVHRGAIRGRVLLAGRPWRRVH